MKSGTIQGLLFTFIGTLVIFAMVKNNISEKISFSKSVSLRFLSNKTTEEITYEMCSNSSSDLVDFYQTTGPNYVFNPPSGNQIIDKILKDFINSSSSSPKIEEKQIKEYFSNSPGYIFILVLIILLIILWIPYTICVCCKCCKCIPKSCLNCPNIMIITTLIFCGLVLINCFIGYSENSSILNGIYGFGCTVLKIEQHLINGDDYKSEKPYWAGIKEIINKLESTKNEISSLGNKTKDIKSQISDIKSNFVSFRQNLTDEYNIRKDTKLRNPDPVGSDFTPDYLLKYGPKTKNGTALWLIDEELSQFKNYSIDTIDLVVDKIDLEQGMTKSIVDNIDTIKTQIDDNINNIDRQIGDQIRKYDDNLDLIDSYSRTAMNVLFSVNLILGIALGVSLVLLFCFKCGGFILCISWFFLYCLMIFSFLLGAIFGIIGSFIQDTSWGASNLIQNLNEVKIDEKIKDIAEICLNGNGSLAQSNLIDINFDTSIIDNIYNLEKNINEGINEIKKYNFKSIQTNEKIYDEIKFNPKNSVKELNSTLYNIKYYIDFSINSTYVSKDTPIYDDWEIREEDCKKKEDKKCIIITEWSLDDILSRYKGINSSNENISIIDNIEKYYKSINAFMESHYNLLNKIKDQNKVYNNSFISFSKEEVNVLNNIKDIITPLRETFNEIVGDGSIFEILNCQFLKRDFNKVIEQLYNSFGSTFKVTSTLLLMISGFEIVMTLLILIIMTSLGKKEEPKPSSKQINFISDEED